MRKLDFMTVSGLFCGIMAISVAIIMGGNCVIFWNLPSVLITVCGSFAALLITFGAAQIRNVLIITKHVFLSKSWDLHELIGILVAMARKARRHGLLALEEDIPQLSDPFFQKAVRMIVDAIEPEMIRQVLETDMRFTARRHELGQRVYRTWAGLAPAFGMIGTLIGLIQMLAQIEDPSKLGEGMALALITTFYGVVMANLILNPMTGKLALRSEEELLIKELILEGVTSIQAGLNPRVLEEKLGSFLAPDQRADSVPPLTGMVEQGDIKAHG
ncbi:MAG: motility protein A [Bacillota bacterium]|jgi:chemotaxis protein MotA